MTDCGAGGNLVSMHKYAKTKKEAAEPAAQAAARIPARSREERRDEDHHDSGCGQGPRVLERCVEKVRRHARHV